MRPWRAPITYRMMYATDRIGDCCDLLNSMKRALEFLILFCTGAFLAPAQVHFTRNESSVAVEVMGKPFTTFYFGDSAPKPYLHPLLTAAGLRLTRLYPMETTEQGSHDHPHHRGLWITHGDVNGVDFWASEPEQRKGKQGLVVLKKVVEMEDGPQSGSLRVLLEWRGPDGTLMVTEDRLMTFSGDENVRIVDFDVFLNVSSKTVFGDTKEGFFAVRLRDEMSEAKGSAHMTNAEGKIGMKQVWGKPSRWVDYAGTLEGHKVGIAIFDHPGNPRYPTWWHARDYGLFAANPFGERDFTGDKLKNGSLTVEAGKNLHFRYGVLIHPGDTTEAGIEAAWKVWSTR